MYFCCVHNTKQGGTDDVPEWGKPLQVNNRSYSEGKDRESNSISDSEHIPIQKIQETLLGTLGIMVGLTLGNPSQPRNEGFYAQQKPKEQQVYRNGNDTQFGPLSGVFAQFVTSDLRFYPKLILPRFVVFVNRLMLKRDLVFHN